MWIPGLIAGPAMIVVAVGAFRRPAPIARFFFEHGDGRRMTPGTVRAVSVMLAFIGVGWTILSLFGEPVPPEH